MVASSGKPYRTPTLVKQLPICRVQEDVRPFSDDKFYYSALPLLGDWLP